MDYLEFFTIDNKSGYKTKDKWLKNNHPDLYDKIINFINDDWFVILSFREKIWYFINNITTKKVCLVCGNDLKFRKSLLSGYGDYCSMLCTNTCETRKEKIVHSNLNKYGVSSTTQLEVVKEKIRKTNLEKYGVDNIFKNTDYIKSKTKEKFGVEHPLQSEEIKKKFKQTNLEKYGVETPLLLSSSKDKKLESHKNTFFDKYQDLNIIDYDGDNINIFCGKCNSNYVINRAVLWHRANQNFNPCTICNPIKKGVSISENDIRDFLKDFEIVFNDRKILNGKELDIVIPSKKTAIEYNGLYWHSDFYIDSNYHLEKTELCEKNGYQLIHIFEDEWLYKKEIVKSRILNLMGNSSNKIYARKCVIKEVSIKDSRKFLEENHIQGYVNSKYRIGLYFNDELVSLMTFGSLRKSLGQESKEGHFELLRFCNKLNTNVVGGASKLFKYFTKNYKFESIISYADRRWSQGKLYQTLGFTFLYNTKPNYFYFKGQVRENRFKYRKSELINQGYDPTKTEKEIMVERGFGRIYDCGAKKYEYKKRG